MARAKSIRYKDAGVNIDEADRAVSRIKSLARGTFTRGVLTEIGTFGAGYRLSGWKQPVLVVVGRRRGHQGEGGLHKPAATTRWARTW